MIGVFVTFIRVAYGRMIYMSVPWPWKHDISDLPGNRSLSIRRLKSLVHRMKTK